MYLINLFIFIIAIYFLSLIIGQRIELVLPVATAAWLVMLYGLAIIGYAHHSFHLSVVMYILIYTMYVVRKRKLFPDGNMLRDSLLSQEHVGFFVYLTAVIVAFYCYSNHVVNVWDDFHYNATFPKNMFYYGTMPYGYQSTTGYKDYFPTQQLFFYWGFQSAKKFSEAMMFQYKLFLAYTFTLPIFNEINYGKAAKRVISTIIAIVIPYMCLFEIFESLSMDTVLALIFANALFGIIRRDKSWFGYGYIAAMLMALVLYKSYALIFACIAIAAWFFVEIIGFRELEKSVKLKTAIVFIVTCLATGGCYISWKVFCKTHGNTTYLSDILSDNMKSGGVEFPAYTITTIKSILRSLWCMRLNFGQLSVTVISSILIYLVVVFLMILYKKYNKSDLAMDIMVIAGLVGFIVFLMYTYVFIFEQWEAESLSSLDRYLGTYVLVIMFISAYRCLNVIADCDITPAILFTLACVISLNYSLINDSLIPKNYANTHSEIIEMRNQVAREISQYNLSSLGPASVVLVSDEEDTLYMRSMQYECIPLHAYQFVITESNDRSGDLVERAADTGADYVIITNHGKEYVGDSLDVLCDINVEALNTGLYRYNRESNMIVERVR